MDNKNSLYELLEIDQDTIHLAQQLVAEMRALQVDREIMEALGESYPKSARIMELDPVDIRVNIEDRAVVDPLTFKGCTAMSERRLNDPDELLSADELELDFDLEDNFASEEAAALNEPMTVKGFLSALEEFLDRLPDAKRGSVFLSQAGDGVCVNLLVGMAFAGSDSQIKQMNIIIAPTDREFLNSQGTAITDSREDEVSGPALDPSVIDELKKEELRQACRDAGIAYGRLNNDGMREALKAHAAFDQARQVLDGGY